MLNILEKHLPKSKRKAMCSLWKTESAAKDFLLGNGLRFKHTKKSWITMYGNITPDQLSAISYLHYEHGYGWFI